MHDYYTKIFMRQKEKLKHAIIAIVILTAITPASSHPQTIPLIWRRVASGVWKVKIGAPQKFDLLTTANIHSGIEALKDLGETSFPFVKRDCYAELQNGKIYLRFPIDEEEQLFGLGQFLRFSNN